MTIPQIASTVKQGSWRTGLAGVLTALVTILPQIVYAIDGDPATITDWNTVVAGGIAAIGFLAARDNKVTSEAAGAV